jgi:cytoskeletal protein CcmA (bactofilin family)
MLRRALGVDQGKGESSDRAKGYATPSDPPTAEATGGIESMEGKDMVDGERDMRPAAAAPNGLNALLGKGSEFDGKLAFEGTVRIDGTFSGEITTSDTLIVGDGARVQAEISCGTIVVHGEVGGNIHATQAVELHRPARVTGDITSPSLMVEKGVIFEGHSKMLDAERSKIVPISAAEAD